MHHVLLHTLIGLLSNVVMFGVLAFNLVRLFQVDKKNAKLTCENIRLKHMLDARDEGLAPGFYGHSQCFMGLEAGGEIYVGDIARMVGGKFVPMAVDNRTAGSDIILISPDELSVLADKLISRACEIRDAASGEE